MTWTPQTGAAVVFSYLGGVYSGRFVDADVQAMPGTEFWLIDADDENCTYPQYMIQPHNVIVLETGSRFGTVEGTIFGELPEDDGFGGW